MQPYEIIMSPAEVYIALEGEAFPAVDASPSGNWARLGKSGTRSQSMDGVVVTHGQTIERHSTAGATGAVKAVRTEESLMLAMTIEDLTLETYAKALNGAGIGETSQASGVAGNKVIGLSQGIDVTTYSLLVRFPSPEGDGLNAQFEIPKCYNESSPAPKFAGDGTAAGLAFQMVVLEDPNASSEKERHGRLRVQTTPAAV